MVPFIKNTQFMIQEVMLLVITLVEHAKTTICIAPEVTSLACVQGMLIVDAVHHIQVKLSYDIRLYL